MTKLKEHDVPEKKSNKKTKMEEEIPVDEEMNREAETGQESGDIYDSTGPEAGEEKIRRVGDQLTDLADKGVVALKDAFQKIRHFSNDATELTKLKVEIRRLRGEKEKRLCSIGNRLWKMQQDGSLENVAGVFKEDFEQLTALEKEIEQKEDEAAEIKL